MSGGMMIGEMFEIGLLQGTIMLNIEQEWTSEIGIDAKGNRLFVYTASRRDKDVQPALVLYDPKRIDLETLRATVRFNWQTLSENDELPMREATQAELDDAVVAAITHYANYMMDKKLLNEEETA